VFSGGTDGLITTSSGNLYIGVNNQYTNISLGSTETQIGPLSQLQIYNDQIGTTQGTAVTLNSNLNIAVSGTANFAFDINGYDSFLSVVTSCAAGDVTPISNPFGIISGLHAIMYNIAGSSPCDGFSSIAFYDAYLQQWTDGGGGLGFQAGGAVGISFQNIAPQTINIQNTGPAALNICVRYIRLTGGIFNYPAP